MSQIKFVEKIKTHTLCSVTFFPENPAVYKKISKSMVEPERPQMTIWCRVTCWIIKATLAQAHACARAPTHTHTRISAGARTYSRTHTHIEMCNSLLISFRLQQWLCERALMYFICDLPVLFDS